MLKRSTRCCPYPECGSTFRGEADDDQHGANMRAEAELVDHLALEHPLEVNRGA